MEKPEYLRQFTKEHSPEERDKAAAEIREIRRTEREDKTERRERNEDLEATKAKLDGLRAELEGFDSWRSKVMDYFHYRSVKSELALSQERFDDLSAESDSPPQYDGAKKALERFYSDQKAKWERTPYTKEDMEREFTEERLASLPLPEYVDLLKRFPSEMVTHVTRQGVRDHLGLTGHLAGFGEYWNGFKSILEGKRLQSHMSMLLENDEKLAAVQRFIGTKKHETPERAREAVDTMLEPSMQGDDGSFADFTAIHAATEEVADAYYGAEKGNEIFFAFPSAMIASQYHFKGQLTEGDASYHNNQWIWAKEQDGIGIDAAVTFIPGESRVSRRTGSRYELGEDMRPLPNAADEDRIVEFLKSEDSETLLRELEGTLGNLRIGGRELLGDEDPRNAEAREKAIALRRSLAERLGTGDDRLLDGFLEYGNVSSMMAARSQSEASGNESFLRTGARGFLNERGMRFQEAADPVTGQEFWESYFADNPDKRPSKVVYYQGEDPTRALREWKRANGLTKAADSPDLGFEEHSVDLREPSDSERIIEMTGASQRFKSIAEEAIDADFASRPAAAA